MMLDVLSPRTGSERSQQKVTAQLVITPSWDNISMICDGTYIQVKYSIYSEIAAGDKLAIEIVFSMKHCMTSS